MAANYSVGQQVEVNSATHGGWVSATVMGVSEHPYAITVKYDDHPLQKIIMAEQLAMLRPKVPLYVPGLDIEVYSETFGGWVAARVLDVSMQPYAVTVQYATSNMQKVVPGDRLALLRPARQGPDLLRGGSAGFHSASKHIVMGGVQGPGEQAFAVVFLDVDGVLHSLYGEEIFAPSCCAALQRILMNYPAGARVVLSNQWAREGGDRVGMVDTLLRQWGLPGLYSTTEDLDEDPTAEICSWLDRHPEVSTWVALDDANLTIGDNPQARRLCGRALRTDKHVGLTQRDAELALRVLCDGADVEKLTVELPLAQLSPEEAARSMASKAAEAETWESLRNGDLAKMESQFFGATQ